MATTLTDLTFHIWQSTAYKPYEKLILLALISHQSKEQLPDKIILESPGQVILEKLTGLSRSTISHHLKELCEIGVLNNAGDGKHGRGRRDRWTMHLTPVRHRRKNVSEQDGLVINKLESNISSPICTEDIFPEEKVEEHYILGEGQEIKCINLIPFPDKKVSEQYVLQEASLGKGINPIPFKSEKVLNQDLLHEYNNNSCINNSPNKNTNHVFNSLKGHENNRAVETDEPPFSTLSESTEQFPHRTISDALRDLFPEVTMNRNQAFELEQFVLNQQATTDDLDCWRTWIAKRYPGTLANRLKFLDTFALMKRELNFERMSPGIRFVARITIGSKDAWDQLSQKELDVIQTVGNELQKMVNLELISEWKKRGITVDGDRGFQAWFTQQFPKLVINTRPRPETILKYFPDYLRYIHFQISK